MGCEIPEDVGIRLEESKIEPGGIDVVDITEIAMLDDVAQVGDRRVVLVDVTDHQTRWFCSASAISSQHSSVLVASGFLTRPCFPAWSAAPSSLRWVEIGVAM